MAKKGLRILLVSPYGNTPNRFFPLSLGYLKSNTPQQHTIKILDATFDRMPANSAGFQQILRKFNPDVVGITVHSVVFEEAINICRGSKAVNPNIITVMGGAHPTTSPETVMENQDIDYVFRGESELSFPKFLDQLEGERDFSGVMGLVYRKNRALIKNDMERESDLDSIKLPDYEALQLDEHIKRGYFYGGAYGRTAPIWVTRGCPYQCQYCSAPLINGRKVRVHSVSYMVNLINYLRVRFSIEQFTIIDDNFTFYLDYAKEFCRKIIELKEKGLLDNNIRFTTPNGIRMERIDDELLHLMRQAGWHEVGIAPESGSLKTLKRMKKHINLDKVPGIVDRIKAAGLSVRGFFILGYPGETKEDIKATIALIRKCRFDGILMGRFVPIPGTPVFDELVRLGEITPDYLPRDFNIARPLQDEKKEGLYIPSSLKGGLNLFRITLTERILLSIKNPYSILLFIKYNGGIINIIKRLHFSWRVSQ
jgi:radical SAM superfamily enzyme YgiQ (UPF0313 family)